MNGILSASTTAESRPQLPRSRPGANCDGHHQLTSWTLRDDNPRVRSHRTSAERPSSPAAGRRNASPPSHLIQRIAYNYNDFYSCYYYNYYYFCYCHHCCCCCCCSIYLPSAYLLREKCSSGNAIPASSSRGQGTVDSGVEDYPSFVLVLLLNAMGCRHSAQDQSEDGDRPVESLRYKRRSTKFLFGMRKRSSKLRTEAPTSTSSPPEANMNFSPSVDAAAATAAGDNSAAAAAAAAAEGNSREVSPGCRSPGTKNSSEIAAAPSSSPLSRLGLLGKSHAKNVNKNTNERAQRLFGGSRHKNTSNVLSLSVDTPEAADIEGTFENTHVFPIWDSHYGDGCHCVNMDLYDDPSAAAASSSSSSVPPKKARQGSVPTAHLCRRCSQEVVSIQNNKRGVVAANNNNASSGAESGGGGGEAGGGGGGDVKQTQIVAIANLLALAALDLSAPASSLLVKNRKNAWIQLAGHPGSFAPAGPNTIWKKRIVKENYETLAYQALSDFPQSRGIMPAFYREVEFNGEYFIEMEDLLHHFNDPSIMDIKMGTRTFLESEVKNPVLRKDLFEKMIKLDTSAPTAEEKEQEAITKLRYMQFREQESSTASLGFRIEAIRMSGEPPNTNLKKVKTKGEVSYFIQNFTQGHAEVIPTLHSDLRNIRERFESIPLFSTREIIGSSLLIMYDRSNHAGVWMIDFAKTIPVTDVTVNHRTPWKLGNHEDGYLFGLDNLIEIFGHLAEADGIKDGIKEPELGEDLAKIPS